MIDILCLLDRSGSMEHAKLDHEGGLRSFVKDQQELEGDVRFTFIQFDSVDHCEVIYDRVPIADVKDILLIPRGWTPLLDAVGNATAHLLAKQATAPSDHTVFMIITDGQENDSKEWTKERVKAALTELEKKGWTILYLGANVDAFAEAGMLGVPMAGTMNFNNASPTAVSAVYAATSSNLARARRQHAASAGIHGMSNTMAWEEAISANMSYTDDQRESAMNSTTDKTEDKA